MKLTLPQQDIYFDQCLSPNASIYNIGAKITIEGVLNIELLQKAYTVLVAQHDILRLSLTKDFEGNALFEMRPCPDLRLNYLDFESLSDTIQELNHFAEKEIIKPFDLFSGEILHRSFLVRVAKNKHYIISIYHHIIVDGWATSLLFQRMVKNYNELLEFGEVSTTYPYSYEEFIENDEAYFLSQSYEEDKTYWTNKFKLLPESLFEKKKDSTSIARSKREVLLLKREQYNLLNNIAKENRVSIFHVILASLFTYFGRKHQKNDISIGLPVLNRSKATFKRTVGLFMGISPLRIHLNFEETFSDLVLKVKKHLKQDYRHQRYPLGKLVNELNLYEDKLQLFNITLSYEKQDYSINFSNTKTRVIPLSHQSERVALAIYIREFDESEDVKIDFDYNVNYFNENEIRRVVNHVERVLLNILYNPRVPLKEIGYLTDKERLLFEHKFVGASVSIPKQLTLLNYFEKQVNLYPDEIVVLDQDTSYTYGDLDKLSNRIASNISQLTEGRQSTIAVLLNRSANLVALLLAIFKSGNAYIPLDPSFPSERLLYILRESNAHLLITEQGQKALDVDPIKVYTIEEAINNHIRELSPVHLKPEDTAYIIYTSGSTGKPKGVEISHFSLLNFLLSMKEQPGINSNDTLYAVTTFSFDISILEFFLPLITGSKLYVASTETLADPLLIIEELDKVNPTIIQATPSFYQMLFNAGWKGDNNLKILCGGDLLSKTLAEKIMNSSLELWNMYGPTETTIWSSIKRIKKAHDASNIGTAIYNTRFYILDDCMNLSSINTAGKIYIGGSGLAKGYYLNKELTKEKFIEYPGNSSIIYETGDIGQWTEHGEIIFLGRYDNQVKIRGYRVELGDIEHQLNQIHGIREAVVVAKKNIDNDAYLVAYLISEIEMERSLIQSTLERKLPQYMVPKAYQFIDEFPLTPNKKIDRKTLTAKDFLFPNNNKALILPQSKISLKLADIWRKVLGIAIPISTDDNFFELGGHSLNAVKLTGLVYEYFGSRLSLKDVFRNPTLEKMATLLEKYKKEHTPQIERAIVKPLYFITPAQYQIWLASLNSNYSKAYHLNAAYSIKGKIDLQILENTIQSIIRKYEIIRTNFVEQDAKIFQKIKSLDEVEFAISVIKIKSENLITVMEEYTNKIFDLENDILIRILLIEQDIGNSMLLFSTHHIIMDGWSLQLLLGEIVSGYNYLKKNPILASESLNIQFKDYAEWLKKKMLDKQSCDFWHKKLDGFSRKKLLLDELGQSVQNKGSERVIDFSSQVFLSIKKRCVEEKITIHTFLVTLFKVLLYKKTGIKDICIGTVNAARDSPILHQQIGMYVQTLPLRTKLDTSESFFSLARRIQEDLLQVDQYKFLPKKLFDQKWFDLLLVYRKQDETNMDIKEMEGCELKKIPLKRKFSKPYTIFNFLETTHQLHAVIEYNSKEYSNDTIDLIVAAVENLLKEVLEYKTLPIELKSLSQTTKENIENFDFNF